MEPTPASPQNSSSLSVQDQDVKKPDSDNQGQSGSHQVRITPTTEPYLEHQTGSSVDAQALESKSITAISENQPSADSSETQLLSFGKDFTLPAITEDQAEAFWANFQDLAFGNTATRRYKNALESLYKSMGLSESQIALITRTYHRDLHLFFDVNFSGDATIPLLHTQVVLTDSEGKETRTCANRISYEGRKYGVAMAGKTAANLEQVIPLIWQEGIGIHLDLQNDTTGGGDAYKQANTKKAWSEELPLNTPCQFGDLTVKKTSETMLDADTVKQQFSLEHAVTGEVRTFTRLHYLGWHDQGVIESEQLLNLQKLVTEQLRLVPDQPYFSVNCLAGVGRTGTFFATRRILDLAHDENDEEDDAVSDDNIEENSGPSYHQTVLNVLLEGKTQRNNDFVQTGSQVELVHNFLLELPGEEEKNGAENTDPQKGTS